MPPLRLNYGGGPSTTPITNAHASNTSLYTFSALGSGGAGGGGDTANPHHDDDELPPPAGAPPPLSALQTSSVGAGGGGGAFGTSNIISGTATVSSSSNAGLSSLPLPATTTNTQPPFGRTGSIGGGGGLGLNYSGSAAAYSFRGPTSDASFGGGGAAFSQTHPAASNEQTRWGTSLDVLPPPPPHEASDDDEDDGHVNLPSMPRPSQQFRPTDTTEEGGYGGAFDGLNSFGGDFGDGESSDPMPPFPSPDDPVVPSRHKDQLELTNAPLDWSAYASSRIVSSLLKDRGAVLPAHSALFEYHMAQPFLECLEVLREGSYFVYYQSQTAAPKERYFRVEMGEAANGRMIPFLNWYLHKGAVALADRVPLTNLVGVTPSNRSTVFRAHMVNAHTIVGCFSGDSRSRLPVSGCLTLWFWDPYYGIPRSVDILSTNPIAHRLWVMAMRGVLSVNSVSIGTRRSDLAAQLAEVQRLMAEEEAAGAAAVDVS